MGGVTILRNFTSIALRPSALDPAYISSRTRSMVQLASFAEFSNLANVVSMKLDQTQEEGEYTEEEEEWWEEEEVVIVEEEEEFTEEEEEWWEEEEVVIVEENVTSARRHKRDASAYTQDLGRRNATALVHQSGTKLNSRFKGRATGQSALPGKTANKRYTNAAKILGGGQAKTASATNHRDAQSGKKATNSGGRRISDRPHGGPGDKALATNRRDVVGDMREELIVSLRSLTSKSPSTPESALETISTLSRLAQPTNTLEASLISAEILFSQINIARGQAMMEADAQKVVSIVLNVIAVTMQNKSNAASSAVNQEVLSHQLTESVTLALTESSRLLTLDGDAKALCGEPLNCSTSASLFFSKVVSPPGLSSLTSHWSKYSDTASVAFSSQVLQDSPNLAAASAIVVHMYRWPIIWKKENHNFISNMHTISLAPNFVNIKISKLTAPAEISIPVQLDVEKGRLHWECVAWTGSSWSNSGCSALAAAGAVVTCACDHLTEFAVIVDPSRARCGDGRRTANEQCDDAGTTAGDGCSAECTVEGGYVCIGGTTTVADTCVQRDPTMACPIGKVGGDCENVCRSVMVNGACDPADVVAPTQTVVKMVDGAIGALLELSSGQSIAIPKGAFSGKRSISMTLYDAFPKVSQGSLVPNAPIVEMGPDGLRLLVNATLTLTFPKPFNQSAFSLGMYTLSMGQKWVDFGPAQLDPSTNKITSSNIAHFSLYTTFLVPASQTSVDITPGPAGVVPRQDVGTVVWVVIVAIVVPVCVCGLCLLLLYYWYARRRRAELERKKQRLESAVVEFDEQVRCCCFFFWYYLCVSVCSPHLCF
jgi:cysteine-rich repeat protein